MSHPAEIAFHFNVAHKVPYLCRLLRKAHQAQKKVQVCGPEDLLAQLDVELWTFAQDAFLPHARADEPSWLLTRTSIVLGDTPVQGLGSDVLVNCHPHLPQWHVPFARVIEVVGLSEEERAPARDRWRAYTAMGCTLVRHDALQVGNLAREGGR
jgi:DNA polymerase III subunit chi